jgi:hypothetical protein
LTGDMAEDCKRYGEAFRPLANVDYSAAVSYAKGLFENRLADFDDIDAKASAVIGYMGSTAGVLTVGSLVAAVTSSISPWVILAAVPSIGCAVASLIHVVRCRQTASIPVPFGVNNVIAAVEHYANEGHTDYKALADANQIGGWMTADAELATQVRTKAKKANTALWFYVASVAALILPLLVAIGIKFNQTTPRIIEDRSPAQPSAR